MYRRRPHCYCEDCLMVSLFGNEHSETKAKRDYEYSSIRPDVVSKRLVEKDESIIQKKLQLNMKQLPAELQLKILKYLPLYNFLSLSPLKATHDEMNETYKYCDVKYANFDDYFIHKSIYHVRLCDFNKNSDNKIQTYQVMDNKHWRMFNLYCKLDEIYYEDLYDNYAGFKVLRDEYKIFVSEIDEWEYQNYNNGACVVKKIKKSFAVSDKFVPSILRKRKIPKLTHDDWDYSTDEEYDDEMCTIKKQKKSFTRIFMKGPFKKYQLCKLTYFYLNGKFYNPCKYLNDYCVNEEQVKNELRINFKNKKNYIIEQYFLINSQLINKCNIYDDFKPNPEELNQLVDNDDTRLCDDHSELFHDDFKNNEYFFPLFNEKHDHPIYYYK
ncbi:hypothetical protein [Urbanus proteus nucleopolyhedrovirus]|uniref:F-box domain-containing protein n=1 Tax=Urbanus proteus nucleopolyhedrovirus TaxID=1675866 RepID=A0A162GTJ2_9ABAC|nr:hypothetical protein [Urbanus proteus nucleopolyhedrovirus]AKR17276.1 hypothetical protein [Urbanus proteus nucleopolyhedrovirus]